MLLIVVLTGRSLQLVASAVESGKTARFSAAFRYYFGVAERTTRCVQNAATTVRSLLCWNQTTGATMGPGMRVLLLLKHFPFRFLLVTKH